MRVQPTSLPLSTEGEHPMVAPGAIATDEQQHRGCSADYRLSATASAHGQLTSRSTGRSTASPALRYEATRCLTTASIAAGGPAVRAFRVPERIRREYPRGAKAGVSARQSRRPNSSGKAARLPVVVGEWVAFDELDEAELVQEPGARAWTQLGLTSRGCG